ncbi:MAG: packaged DNA stabilization protein [Gallionella sp.]|jgi:hypothetical protein
MKPISIFGLGTQSKSSNVTSQQRVNFYLEIAADADKNTVTAYGTPGLVQHASIGASPTRGMYTLGNYIYVVNLSKLWRVDNSGVAVEKGTLLTTTGRVSMADNGSVGDQIIIVDGTYGYIYTVSTGAFAQIADLDFPGADTVTFNDGYFIVSKPDTGQFYLSGSYNGTTWDALDFATGESNPDNVISVVADHGELIVFGDVSTEFWTNTGSLDFPYSRSGAAVEWGLAARWSVAKFDNSLIYLAKNRMGEVQVVRLNGYLPDRVSTPDMETIINKYSGISDATGFSYLLNGHPFYQINFTSANESWLYDGLSKEWSQLKSGTGRHRAEMGTNFLLRTVVSDYENGKLYNLDSDAYTDDGEMIVAELVTKHVFNNLERYSISELQVDLESGVGLASGQGEDPQIMLQVSKDGGHTWGAERWVSMGKLGEYTKRAKWNRLGQSRNWTFKLKISDPVKRVILGAYVTGA